MARIRADYVFGTTDAALTATDTTLSSPTLSRLPVVASPDVAAITLHDPTAGTYEIVHVTAHAASATSATIARGREGSTARGWGAGSSWLHGSTAMDGNTESAGLFRGKWSPASIRLVDQYLTGNTNAPAPYIVTVSAEYPTDQGFRAFNADLGDFWRAAAANPVWLAINLGSSKRLVRYTLHARYDGPTQWKVQGSDDGATWVDVDSRTFTWSGSGSTQSFTLEAPVTYRRFRLYLPVDGGNSPIYDWALYDEADPYMGGEYVVHNGKLWRSDVDNNEATPGVSSWTEISLGYDQVVTTANRPTGIAAGAHVFDSTLGKPVWFNGTGWVDSAGISA